MAKKIGRGGRSVRKGVQGVKGKDGWRRCKKIGERSLGKKLELEKSD